MENVRSFLFTSNVSAYISSVAESIMNVFLYNEMPCIYIVLESTENLFTRERSDNSNDLKERMGWVKMAQNDLFILGGIQNSGINYMQKKNQASQ